MRKYSPVNGGMTIPIQLKTHLFLTVAPWHVYIYTYIYNIIYIYIYTYVYIYIRIYILIPVGIRRVTLGPQFVDYNPAALG